VKVGADLFCGLGGFTAGAERTGLVRVDLAINHKAVAVQTHEANHPHVQHVQQDLLEFDMRQLPDLDVLLASPSCKDDSPASRPSKKGTGGNGKVDVEKVLAQRASDRNTATAVLGAVEAKRPEFLVVENVREFTERPTFGAWLSYLEALGYGLSWRIVNALEFGGCTDRARFILAGRLGGAAPELPVGPLHSTLDFSRGPGFTRVGANHPNTIGSILDADDHPDNRWIDCASDSDRMQALVAKAKREAGERCFVNNVGDGVRGRPLDDIFPSLTTQSGTQFILIDGERRRVLNAGEMARIMGWERDVILPRNKKTAGVLIGNAIHLDVAEYAVRQAVAA